MGNRTAPRLATILLLLLSPWTARAWDSGGHMLVAEIAFRQLKPGVAEKIEPLLPLLDTRFNNGQPYNFVTAGPWLDDIKSLGSEYPWSKWHYVNLECTGDPKPPVPPSGENADWAIRHAITVLRSPEAQSQSQAEAVAQLIHIVGDIHQPLHAASRNDRGGNGYLLVPVVPRKEEANGYSTKPFNLHQFWDGAYRYGVSKGKIVELAPFSRSARRPKAPSEKGHPVSRQAELLLAKYPLKSLPELTAVPADSWAWICESHAIGCKNGWPPGPPPRSYEVGRLTPSFVEKAHGIAERRIVLAGYRLATLLNALFATTDQ